MFVTIVALAVFAAVAVGQPPKPSAEVQAAFCECAGGFESAVGADLVAQVEACLAEAGAPVEEMKSACNRRKRAATKTKSKSKMGGSSAADDLDDIADTVAKRMPGKGKGKEQAQKKMEECLSGKGVSEADLTKIKDAGESLHECVKSKLPGSGSGGD